MFGPILALLYILGFSNLFLRSSFGVMAPDLARELDLTPAMLSGVASAFFFAYALMQVPTGMLLDRFGPRRTLSTMLLFTMAGAMVFAAGTSAEMLGIGRILMGIGCAGIFTGAFYVMAIWMPPERVVTQIGMMNSFASFGTLCSTTPFALLLAAIGWRMSYWIFAGGVALVMLAVAVWMRDAPPGRAPPASKDETLAQIFTGVRDVLRQRGMRRMLVVGLPMSALSTLSGVWAAPYLRDVHGLDGVTRGNVLLGMALGGMLGHFSYGQLAYRINSLRTTIIGGSLVILAATSALALMAKPPLGLVVALFCLIGLASSYPTITHAQARGLVPPHLMGRGVSVTNMGVMSAIAFMQFAFGWVVGLFPETGGASPEIAYRAGFALIAVLAVVALVIYLPIPDVKPRPGLAAKAT